MKTASTTSFMTCPVYAAKGQRRAEGHPPTTQSRFPDLGFVINMKDSQAEISDGLKNENNKTPRHMIGLLSQQTKYFKSYLAIYMFLLKNKKEPINVRRGDKDSELQDGKCTNEVLFVLNS